MILVDTHAHLTHTRFRDDLDAVVQRAADAGVGAIITLATTLQECETALQLAERFPPVFAAVGVHPNDADGAPTEVTGDLTRFAMHPKAVAVGETGMDYHYLPRRTERELAALVASQDRQKRLFTQQLELAARLDKPVVVHQRDCAEELLEVMAPYRDRVRGVIHCFSESPDVARRVLELGFHISFTGMLTFKRNTALRELAAQLPLDRLLLETDCPYMAPEPHRGKRCEPAFVARTAAALAAARGMSLEEVAHRTTENAIRLFGIRA